MTPARGGLLAGLLLLAGLWSFAAHAQKAGAAPDPGERVLDLLFGIARDHDQTGDDGQSGGRDDARPTDPDGGDVAGDDCATTANGTAAADCPEDDVSRDDTGSRDPGGLPPLVIPGVLVDLVESLTPRAPEPPSGGRATGGSAVNGSAGGGTPAAGPRRPAPRRNPARLARAVRALPPAPSAGQAVFGPHVPDEVLIVVGGDEAEAQAVAADNNLEVRSLRTSGLLGAVTARLGIPDGRPVALVLGQLARDARVVERVPNHLYDLQQAAALPQYALAKLTLDPEAAPDLGGGVRIAVIDTGVDETSPALVGAVAASFDAVPDIPVNSRAHGTSVAALIAGRGAFSGAAPGADLLIVRAFDLAADGASRSTVDAILAGLDWAWEEHAAVVNMSFTGPRNRLIALACDEAARFGLHLVAAAGNNGPGAPFAYPAALDSVMAVTAIDAEDRVMEMANRGRYVDFSAPGVDLVAPIPGGVDFVTGTSFAAALVSGVAAAVHGAHGGLSPRMMAQRLSTSARDLGRPGRDETFGFGLIDAQEALK